MDLSLVGGTFLAPLSRYGLANVRLVKYPKEKEASVIGHLF
jgi:hypothetical protein